MAGTGFVQGFNVGFNAVNSALRLAQLKEESDRRNKREDEKWGYEKGELDRKRTLAADLAAAGSEPTSGVVVGEPGSRNFADSPDEQAFLREQDAAIADLQGTKPSAAKMAVGSGRNILDPSDARAQKGQRGYTSRVADAYRKAGEVDKALTVESIQRGIEKSGIKDSLTHLFASNGDAAGAQRIREQASGPLGGTLIAERTERVGADGTKIPDYNLSIRDEQGNVRPLGSAFSMLYMAENPAEYMKLIKDEQATAGKNKNEAAKLALDERRVGVLEQNARTMEGYRRDQMQLARERAAGGPGSGEGQPLQFTAPSASDQKALRELIVEGATEGQDVNVANDLAQRLSMANPGMTMADAARVALTPGVVERPVNTPYGVLPALVTPDGRAVVMAPRAGQQGKPAEAKPAESKPAPKDSGPSGWEKFKSGAWNALVEPAPPRKASPAEIAAQPPKREQPPPTIYQNAVNAMRAEQQRLITQAQSATPEQQAELQRQVQELEAQIQRTIATRGVK